MSVSCRHLASHAPAGGQWTRLTNFWETRSQHGRDDVRSYLAEPVVTLSSAMPACDTTSSCEPVPPLAPIAPMTLPSTMIGLPPRGNHVIEGRQVFEVVAFAEQVFKYRRRTAVACRGARFVLRDRDRSILAIVQRLKVHQFAVRVDDGDTHRVPISFLGFCDRRRGHFLGGLDINRVAVGRQIRRLRYGIVRIVRIGRGLHLGKSRTANHQRDACGTRRHSQMSHSFLPRGCAPVIPAPFIRPTGPPCAYPNGGLCLWFRRLGSQR